MSSKCWHFLKKQHGSSAGGIIAGRTYLIL